MGGQSGLKGYLLQTLICVIDALNEDDWTEIVLEPCGESEKVDICWIYKNGSNKKVQVKHSQRQIAVRMAKKWAGELEADTTADELELRLLGTISEDLSDKKYRRIGAVAVPLPKGVNEDSLLAEASHKLNLLISKQRKYSPVTPTACEVLVAALHLKFEIYSTSGKPISRSEFEKQVWEWVAEFAGPDTVEFNQRVLSFNPRTIRSNRFEFLQSRKDCLQWVEQTTGDKLICGQPGIGKTFLLQEYVKLGNGMFVIKHDEDSLGNAIVAHGPESVVVEDAHFFAETIETLQRIRRDKNLQFEIVADCWPGGSDKLRQQLFLKESNFLELAPVNDQDIVDLAKSAGIAGPNSFFHKLVLQSKGFPGRAALLVEACLEGEENDFEKFWNGEILTRSIRAKISDLVGDTGVQILACFSIGGKQGIETRKVADTLGVSVSEVSRAIAGLAMGGVIIERWNERLTVVPEAIRPVLVRDYFFGPGKLPLEPFLHDDAELSSVATTLIQAKCIGAPVERNMLIEFVEKFGNHDTWQAFIYSSESNAAYFFEHQMERAPQFTRELLHMVPRQAIGFLLEQATDDFRPLHSNPSHSLRVLSDWVNAGYPGREAIPRRTAVLESYLSFLDEKTNFELASRLLLFIVTPRFENSETSPGNRLQINLLRGIVTSSDLEEIAKFWPTIIESLPDKIDDWKPILEAVSEWLLSPIRSDTSTGEQISIVKLSAAGILSSLSKLAKARPGVLSELGNLGSFHDVSISLIIDRDFIVLFPKDPVVRGDSSSYRDALTELANSARELGKTWAKHSPSTVIKKIQFCILESSFLSHSWPDHCMIVCEQISELVEAQIPWIIAIQNENARPDLIRPFLTKACRENEETAFEFLRDILEADEFRWEAVQIALTSEAAPQELVEIAIRHVSPKLAEQLTMLRDLPSSTIEAFLNHESSGVRRSAAEGLWHRYKENIASNEWIGSWQIAIIETVSDRFCLTSAMENDIDLRIAWLHYWSKQTKAPLTYFDQEVFETVSVGLDAQQREHLLCELDPMSKLVHRLVPAIVGDSVLTYQILLNSSNLAAYHENPLARTPDETWQSFVELAHRSGIKKEHIAEASRRNANMIRDPAESYDQERQAWEELAKDKSPIVSEVATLAAESANRQSEHMQQLQIRDSIN